MNVAYLCLGGNIGDREATLSEAVKQIAARAGKMESCSPLYETEAWGVTAQQAYLNQCVCVKTALAPLPLLQCLLNIEQGLGRRRTNSAVYEARTIDIDLLLFNDLVLEDKRLVVPHPRMHLRKFVLAPLNDIASGYLHPVFNKTIFNLLAECSDTLEVRPYTP